MNNFKKSSDTGNNTVFKSITLAVVLVIISAFAISISGCKPTLQRYEKNLEMLHANQTLS
ncbi:MAG: hypothetical protein ACYDIA_23140 [Candidatus Humimicrobiaceae bacterium]